MKKQKKILVQLIVFMTILLSGCQAFATNFADYLGEMKFSEEYENYLKLSDEEKQNVIMPRMYNVTTTQKTIKNPLKLFRMLGSTVDSKYSLKDIIPENMVVKDQQNTNSCWTFSSLAALESTLALNDYKNKITPVVYDFSERHMEYATSRVFKDDVINPIGFNRPVGDGGNSYHWMPYLTNGTGAIAESDMEFEDNEDLIYISEIQNKEVITQVNDIITFPAYSSTDDLTLIKQQMKEHIKNYGGIDAGIHGASINNSSNVYNSETGAIYCNSSFSYPIDHAVVIVGWDDNYSIDNFVSTNKPTSNGAWIIKNSWGTGEQLTLAEMKEFIFETFPDDCAENGWNEAAAIPDATAIYNFEQWGYTVENNVATLKIGDDGFTYVSYEDANIYKQLTGIEDAQSNKTYQNIYQYDQYGGILPISFNASKIYLATVFDKKTTLDEYLTHISINTSETYTCKVYVNPNGTSKSMSDLQEVELKTGETATFEAGYHTIEFLNPVKINSDSFVVVLEILDTETNSIEVMMEFNYGEILGDDGSIGYIFDYVEVENGKCFWTTEESIANNEWVDCSTTYELTNGNWPNFDTTIKAFTTSQILQNIEVTTPPTKTSYIVGENFDATGMIVKANYADGTSKEITDYTITGGTNLQAGQTSIKISYEDKTTTQPITVVENSVESIAITTPPTKTEYWAGEDFDATGMVVEATYTDGTSKEITDYTIQNGTTLQNRQTSVTIEFEGLTATQAISVQANEVVKIEITNAPNKVNYVVGQNFDATGMVVKATYQNELEKEVTNYTIQNGANLQIEQTSVTIEFEGQTAIQEITVEEKTITSISVKTMPTKTQYIQNKEELDLTGGVIEISYNDGAKEDLSMTSEQVAVSGFDNKEIGTKTITLTYQGFVATFDVSIVEEPKPENSNFENMSGNVTRVRAYYFTDVEQQEYTIINVELSDIIKATENDSIQYYYYLSSNQEESNIVDWVRVNELQESNNGLSFEINTSEIANYDEVASAENVYLYIKEVAIRNGMTAEELTSSVLLEVENITIEEYLDGEKIADVDSDEIIDGTAGEEPDNTLAPGVIPNAGKSILILFITFIICIIGRISYLRYKDIQIK